MLDQLVDADKSVIYSPIQQQPDPEPPHHDEEDLFRDLEIDGMDNV